MYDKIHYKLKKKKKKKVLYKLKGFQYQGALSKKIPGNLGSLPVTTFLFIWSQFSSSYLMRADTPTSRTKSDADQRDEAKSESERVGDGGFRWWPSGTEVPTPGEV